MHIIIKNYEHLNRSLPNWDTPNGKYVKNKEHYERLCAEAGMVSVDKAGDVGTKKQKDFVLSNKAKEIIESARNAKDKKGNVKLSDRTIDAMKSIGAINKKIPSYMTLPEHYQK